jgi:O-antigen ligase
MMNVWVSSSTHSWPWRGRLAAASERGLPLLLVLGAALIVRVLTDDQASPDSRTSGSLDLSGAIAVLLALMAIGLLLRRRRGVLPTALAALWLCMWTAVGVSTHGASTETLREGVREGSVIALAVIVYNARGTVTVPIAARIVQLMGLVPALLAVYQLATHTGMDIAGDIRSNGTFAHPDSAAMFFAIAATASLWLYLDNGRRSFDALLTALFAAAVIATFSIDGLAALVATLVTLGALRPGFYQAKLGPWLVAGLVVLAFLATPSGAQRISGQSSTSLLTAERGEPNTSLAWRLHKWQTLLPEWEGSPLFGQGLGTTTTTRAMPGNRYAGKPPHNEYVRYLVETGIVGVAILLAGLAILIRVLLRRRASPDTLATGTPNAATLAIAVIVGCLVNALADNTFLNSPTCYAAALIVVAVLASPGVEMRQAPAPQTV